MRFEIARNPLEPKHKDCFAFEVEVMYGDADGYGLVEISGFKRDCEKSKAHMESLVETLEAMRAAYPNGRGGCDTYNHLKGFQKWFSGEIPDDFEEEYESLLEWEQKFYWNDWPRDPSGDGIQSSFEDYSIFYYDEFGSKHEVKVIK